MPERPAPMMSTSTCSAGWRSILVGSDRCIACVAALSAPRGRHNGGGRWRGQPGGLAEHLFHFVEEPLGDGVDLLAAHLGELLEELALLGGELARGLDRDPHQRVAIAVAAQV